MNVLLVGHQDVPRLQQLKKPNLPSVLVRVAVLSLEEHQLKLAARLQVSSLAQAHRIIKVNRMTKGSNLVRQRQLNQPVKARKPNQATQWQDSSLAQVHPILKVNQIVGGSNSVHLRQLSKVVLVGDFSLVNQRSHRIPQKNHLALHSVHQSL